MLVVSSGGWLIAGLAAIIASCVSHRPHDFNDLCHCSTIFWPVIGLSIHMDACVESEESRDVKITSSKSCSKDKPTYLGLIELK